VRTLKKGEKKVKGNMRKGRREREVGRGGESEGR
jgi:hypothetical protein